MESDLTQSLELFYCYASKDRASRDKLDAHLITLRRTGLITAWYDGEIVPGASWEEEIETHLDTADIILLLISPEFIQSDYCYSKEMKRAIERHRTKEARVVPILLCPVDWKGAPFRSLQMLPSDARPIARWPDRDEAFEDVARGIRRVVNELLSQQQATLPHLSTESQSSQQLSRQAITEYDIALSYAGEDRGHAEALAKALRHRKLTVFYDQYEKSDLWGKNLYTYLSDIYQNRAHYCVIFLSQYYASKQWTKHEREAAQARAFRENEEYILPVRLDDTKIPGIPETVAYLNWPPETAETIADALMEKLQRQSGGTPAASSMAKRGISRRTAILFGLAGLATITVAGSELAILLQARPSTQLQSPRNPAEVPPNSAINSSGSMFGLDPQHTRFNPYEHILSSTNVSRLVLYWTASTGGSIHSSPAVANGVVYVGSDKLYAFNAATGKPLWTATTGAGIGSSPAVANGVVYIGCDNHKLYAFNAATGKTLWTASTGDRVGSSPTVTGGVVYVGSWDHSVYAFNAATGKTLWTAFADPGYWIFSSPAVANGVVYVGSYDHKLYAFNAVTGKLLWTASTGYWIFSSPAVANGVVYIGCDDHKLYAFNAATGKTLWTASTGAAVESSPAVANGVVYVGSWDHSVYAFNAATGVHLWTTTTGSVIESSPMVANGVVYVGSRDYSVYAFNATTGKTLWTASTGGVINSSPAVANGVIYIGSYDHKLYAFHLST